MFLATTALEETWPTDNDTPVLFLGEWCRLYSRKERWVNLNAEILPYHWDDRDKLFKDYCYLQKLFEEVLADLSNALNIYHNECRSKKYWRIILGPWLGFFIQIVFDRWEMVHRSIKEYKVSHTKSLKLPLDDILPVCMRDFARMYVDDAWNHWVYVNIIQSSTDVNIVDVESSEEHFCATNKSTKPILNTKYILKKLAGWFLDKKIKNNRYFFIDSALGVKKLTLDVKLRQYPGYYTTPCVKSSNARIKERDKLRDILGSQRHTAFEKFLYSFLPLQLPISYLENYIHLCGVSKKVNWPDNPHLILSTSAHTMNDLFKIWAANKIEQGVKLAIIQHGGLYGVGKWFFLEEHESLVSDYFMTWGWNHKNKKSQLQELPAQKIIKMIGKVKNKKDGGLLLVTDSQPRYSVCLQSSTISSQFIYYLNDQFRFFDSLRNEVQDEVILKLHPDDFGWNQRERWKERIKNIRILPGTMDFYSGLKTSRLFVGTCNSTSFLECLAFNIPTVVYWDPKYWELRDSAVNDYNELKDVGIFHESPESAAILINDIWDNIDEWWGSSSLQRVKNKFCSKYAFTHKNWSSIWADTLRSL